MQNEELRRSQVELAESRDRYLDLYDFSPVGYLTLSVDGVIQDANLTSASLLGVDRKHLVGRRLAGFVAPEEIARWRRLLADVQQGDQREVCDMVFQRPDGASLQGHLECQWTETGRTGSSVRVVLTDVSPRIRAQEALRESEARFRLLAGSAPVGIFQTDARGQATFVNPTFEAMTGIGAPGAKDPRGLEVVHPEDREMVSRTWREAAAAGKPFSAEYRIHERAGAETWVRVFATPTKDIAGAPTGHVGALVDITLPRALHAQLALTSRLAAMGTLVAGVAHEINNPLAAELAEQEMALEIVREVRERLQGSAPIDREAEVRCLGTVVDGLTDAQEGGQRIARIVKELKTFGRPDLKRTRVRLIDVVDQAMHWLPATVGHVATVRVENGDAPDVTASFGQIEQVVVNLVINAARATQAGKPGVVTVRVGPGAVGMGRLEVIDQGTGIDPAILERIFEPFFTTSDVGQGMGLGLAVSHAIVTAHGGTFAVESELGKGSTFRVDLPIADREP
jgi:PAS domain S-box-containing protein